ncbi:MAG: tryptophan 7-halogenase [Bacteroidetes bacterium]|nr:tryptophan 7-halogenase [Bacteroidota bacterium]
MNEYDIAIIGGGPAGSSAATYLSKMGYNVAVFEKEKFPREHVGESLIPFCYYRLKDMGVIDEVRKFATKKPGINFIDKDGRRESVWCFERVLTDGAGMIFHTPRAEFDKCLLDHSAKCGAHIFEEHRVFEVNLENTNEVTLRAQDISGEEKIIRAKFLLDASGQSSFLAKKLNDKTHYAGLDRVAFYRRWVNNKYDDSLNAGMIKIVYLGGEKKGWFWVIPIGRNYLSIGVSLNHDYVREQKKKFTGDDWKNKLYAQELSEAVCLHDILRDSVPEHDTLTISDYSYFAKKKYGKNWAMIGDAGAFLDPIFSSGLFVAMETAFRVTKVVDTHLKKGIDNAQLEFAEAFIDIEGGYRLIEQFVRLFYDQELMKFSDTGSSDDGFQKFLNAYDTFHYLLAGDFFSHWKKYSGFLDTLTKERNFNQFIHYVKSRAGQIADKEYCRYSFEEIYGHLPEKSTIEKQNEKISK